MTNQVLIQLYYSLIYPFLTYSLITWGNTYQTTLLPLIILQKKAVRIMTFSEYKSHSSPLFQKLKILKVSDLIYLYTALFMYDYYSNRLPLIFDNFFKSFNKCINIKPDWRVRFHTICQKQGLITANLTFAFSVLKFGIPLMTHLNLRVVLVSKIS